VRQYHPRLLSYVRSIGGEEDDVQEAFIAAYKAFDGYAEQGKIFAWLKTIARRIVYRRTSASRGATQGVYFSLDSLEEHQVPMVAGGLYEDFASAQGCEEILAAIRRLPKRQQRVVYHRVIGGMSVAETAKVLGMNLSTVKSNSHYGMVNLKHQLKSYLIEGEHIMNCNNAIQYLWQYARNAILPADKAKVEEHIAACTECRDIADSLRELAPHIKPAPQGIIRHYNISFKLANNDVLVYMGCKHHFPNHEEHTQFLIEHNGQMPHYKDDYRMNYDNYMQHLAEFDNEGNRIEVETFESDSPGRTALVYRRIYKIFENHEMNSVATVPKSVNVIYSASPDAPNLHTIGTNNQLGPAARSGLYVAIPAVATNVRIKQGTDVISCGAYQFVYVDAYVAEGQVLNLEATYNIL